MLKKYARSFEMLNANWSLVTSDKEIDALLDQTAGWAQTPFQSAHWLRQCTRYDRAKGHRSILVSGSNGEGLFAVLPLSIRQKFGARQLCWLGQDLNDYNLPLLHPDLQGLVGRSDADKMWRLSARLVGGIDLVNAAKQPEMLEDVNEFAKLKGLGETDRAHFVILSSDWAVTQAQLYGSKTRSRLNGKRNKLKRLGELEYQCLSAPHMIDQALDKLMEWKSAQLEATGASNPFLDPDYRAFFGHAARADGAKGNVAIFAVLLDGDPIALSYALTSDDRWVMYQSAYASGRTAGLSPGQLLNRFVLEQACKGGVKIYDYGYGDEDYKTKFCQHSVGLNRSLIALTPRGFLARSGTCKLLQFKRFLKKNEMLRELALKSNKWLKNRK